jgi:hypothetical protein
MLDNFKLFLRRFMSNKLPPAQSLFSPTNEEVPVFHWYSSITGRDLSISSSCFLTRLDHCKAGTAARHEFLIAYFTVRHDGRDHQTCLVIDRCAALDAEETPDVPKSASSTSLISSSTASSSRTHSTYSSSRPDLIFKNGGPVPAIDQVVLPKLGQEKELHKWVSRKFGEYDVLNTLNIDSRVNSFSATQLAILLDVIHAQNPEYTLRQYQCYWFSLLVFLVIRSQTQGTESPGARIVRQGRLYFLSPEHEANKDQAVTEDEFDKTWKNFLVSFC